MYDTSDTVDSRFSEVFGKTQFDNTFDILVHTQKHPFLAFEDLVY